jgi:very-short-patch-repair endonuclease
LIRDQRLNEAGFRVLRFWNNHVLQEIESVADVIRRALQNDVDETSFPASPSPSQPSP